MMILYKMMIEYKSQNAPPTKVLVNRATTMKVNLTNFDELTRGHLRTKVRKREAALWKS